MIELDWHQRESDPECFEVADVPLPDVGSFACHALVMRNRSRFTHHDLAPGHVAVKVSAMSKALKVVFVHPMYAREAEFMQDAERMIASGWLVAATEAFRKQTGFPQVANA